jgi:hypothetical protein
MAVFCGSPAGGRAKRRYGCFCASAWTDALKYKRIKAQRACLVKHSRRAVKKKSKITLNSAPRRRILCKNDGFSVYDPHRTAPIRTGPPVKRHLLR